MGVGYTVSPLHFLRYLDLSAAHERPIVPGEDPTLARFAAPIGATTKLAGPIHFRSPAIKNILEWRQRLNGKYAEQLGEELTWDERSAFERSEEVATGEDVRLRYVAAVLDRSGSTGVSGLIRRVDLAPDEMQAAFAKAEQRGFGGQFPQLLLGASFWLPFEQGLMIEEPDRDGRTQRYGSLYRFLDELTTLRAAIVDADPTVVRAARADDASKQILVAAWQTVTTVLRLARLAAAKRLPFWTTG